MRNKKTIRKELVNMSMHKLVSHVYDLEQRVDQLRKRYERPLESRLYELQRENEEQLELEKGTA